MSFLRSGYALGFRDERAAFFAQGFEVGLFVVSRAIAPAFLEYADPFVGEGADDRVKGLSAFLALFDEGLGPDRVFGGFLGPIDKPLPGVVVAAQQAVNFAHLAALIGHGRHAERCSEGFRGFTVGCMPFDRRVDARRQDRSGSGQRGDPFRSFALVRKQLGDRPIVSRFWVS